MLAIATREGKRVLLRILLDDSMFKSYFDQFSFVLLKVIRVFFPRSILFFSLNIEWLLDRIFSLISANWGNFWIRRIWFLISHFFNLFSFLIYHFLRKRFSFLIFSFFSSFQIHSNRNLFLVKMYNSRRYLLLILISNKDSLFQRGE